MANIQKSLEEQFQEKKKQIYDNMLIGVSDRHEEDIEKAKQIYYQTCKKVEGLESAEKRMISKLSMSQTKHSLIMADYERIVNSQEPLGPLLELRDNIDNRSIRSSNFFF